jgi:predicted RNase H-like HicB family nuclease
MIFNVTLYRDEDGFWYRDEDGFWVVACPSIPGCINQGNTRDEAIENIIDAIGLCLEVRAEMGMPLMIETCQVEVSL